MVEQLKLDLSGQLSATRKKCPKCGGGSIQTFPAKTVTYFRCQYCRHKWMEMGGRYG